MSKSGSSTRAAGGRAVERTVTLEAPIDVVWRALTDAEELVRWFPLEASVTPGTGGSMTLGWGDLYHDTARITVWQPEQHLQFGFPGEGPAPLMTDYFLAGKAGQTVLRVVTSGFGAGADWEEQFRGVSHGWDFELLGLKHYLERHQGRDRRVAWARGGSTGGYAETWRRLLSPGVIVGAGGLDAARPRDPISIHTGKAAPAAGRVTLWQPPRQVAAVIDALDDALFRAELNGAEGAITVVLWLSTYGLADRIVSEVQGHWRGVLTERFPIETEPGS